MQKTITTRALQLHDIEAAQIPVRKVSRYRDGGSWEAEVYVDDAWVQARHDVSTATTTINGLTATYTAQISIG